jgi:hypothetical protein
MARGPSWRLAAVVLVALVGVSAVAALLRDDDDDRAEEDIPQLFLDAWRRSLESDYRTVATFSRTSNSTGAELRGEIITAQRLPDRFVIDRDGASGLIDGQRVACVFRTQERLRCTEAEAEVTLAEQAETQLERLAAYVEGGSPLYTIEADLETEAGACFELSLTRSIVAPPMGTLARYCFDDATGAPTVTHIERVEADDDIVTTQISDVVTDADLDPATALG